MPRDITHADIIATLTSQPVPVEAYEEHTGGGIVLVRVDVRPDPARPTEDDPYMLLGVGSDYGHRPGTVEIGGYSHYEDDGLWSDGRMRLVDLHNLPVAVAAGADELCRRHFGDMFDALSRAAFTPTPESE